MMILRVQLITGLLFTMGGCSFGSLADSKSESDSVKSDLSSSFEGKLIKEVPSSLGKCMDFSTKPGKCTITRIRINGVEKASGTCSVEVSFSRESIQLKCEGDCEKYTSSGGIFLIVNTEDKIESGQTRFDDRYSDKYLSVQEGSCEAENSEPEM